MFGKPNLPFLLCVSCYREHFTSDASGPQMHGAFPHRKQFSATPAGSCILTPRMTLVTPSPGGSEPVGCPLCF